LRQGGVQGKWGGEKRHYVVTRSIKINTPRGGGESKREEGEWNGQVAAVNEVTSIKIGGDYQGKKKDWGSGFVRNLPL